ncbi:MAG: hypothetical protein J6U50_07660 [Lachnospiraceae bacterium]|nr:hypothetical protein [Lachnospiraceae bacterium]
MKNIKTVLSILLIFAIILGITLYAVSGIFTGKTSADSVTSDVTTEEPADETPEAVLQESEEPPHFLLLNDRKYKTGTGLSLYDLVYAEDSEGDDITGRIVIISDGGFDPYMEGVYEVTYSVSDERCNTAEQTITVSVGDYEHNDYGFFIDGPVLDLLISRDYFVCDVLDEEAAGDFDALTALTSPTSFGAAYDEGACSCFLYKVTPDYLYFFTNKHCPVDSSDTLCIYDYNDNMTEILKEDIRYLKVHPEHDAVENGYLQWDQQMFAVPITYFDIDELLCFRQVHISAEAFDALSPGDVFLMNTQSWRRCQKDIVMENTILYPDCYEETAYHYDEENSIPALSHMVVGELKNAVGSCSGSPCFDRYGNFLGFIWGTTYANGPELVYLDQFVPLPYFLEFTDTIYFR